MRRINRTLAVVALGLTGAFSAFASAAFGGHSTSKRALTTAGTATTSKPAAQPPAKIQDNTDALPPGQVAPTPTAAPSGASGSGSSGSSSGSSSSSSAANQAAADQAAANQAAADQAAAAQAAQAPQSSSAPPVVVSGGS